MHSPPSLEKGNVYREGRRKAGESSALKGKGRGGFASLLILNWSSPGFPISVNGSLFYTNGSKQSTSLIPVFSLKLHIQSISKFYPLKLLNTS